VGTESVSGGEATAAIDTCLLVITGRDSEFELTVDAGGVGTGESVDFCGEGNRGIAG
jgi:hypothetical protein